MVFGILIFRSIFPTLPFVSLDPNQQPGLFPPDWSGVGTTGRWEAFGFTSFGGACGRRFVLIASENGLSSMQLDAKVDRIRAV